ncbi:hypothetical protein AAFH49_21905, partial [Hymenobacter segetis]
MPGVTWVFWQGRRHGQWAVYGRQRVRGRWRPEQRLSTTSQAAWHPKAMADVRGRVWLAWEHPERERSAIVARVCESGRWSAEQIISPPGFSRRIALAATPQGGMWLGY